MEQKNRRNLSLPLWVLAFFLMTFPLETAWSADYFAKPEFGGTCTQADPCYFVTAVNSADHGDKVYFKEGSYFDNNLPDKVLNISKSVTLLGGWDGASSGILAQNPERYPSILDGNRFIDNNASFGGGIANMSPHGKSP